MKNDFLNEPELEFGSGQHIDIRFGLLNYGPLDIKNDSAPKRIKCGIVGTPETIEGVLAWLSKCKNEIPPKKSKQPNLFPKFPGFSPDHCFDSTLITDSKMIRAIPQKIFDDLSKNEQSNQSINEAVESFIQEIKYLAQNIDLNLYICAIPNTLLKFISLDSSEDTVIHDESSIENPKKQLDFHDLLKARAMSIRKPIQLILPSTYDESKRIIQIKHGSLRQLQDEATRAWNIFTAIYYKAGGIPWRLIRTVTDYTVCYVGLSFYKSLDDTTMLTSMAEVFNERGEGIIVRGGIASVSKSDRQPHLEESDAYNLLKLALEVYRKEHGTLPARLVVHKTSKFSEAEKLGCQKAIREKSINSIDLLSISKSFTRLFRNGAYPPLRGTLLHLDDKTHLLYSKGSVNFFSTYPGMYVPRPIIVYCDSTEQTPKTLLTEILALTKMNWNNTQFDNSFPITIEASRNVGNILKYINSEENIEPRYSYYM